MKTMIFCAAVLLSLQSPGQQTKANNKGAKTQPNKRFEMKQYYFVMLVKGARRSEITDTNKLNELQAGHMANIQRLADMGTLMVAGPFGDEGDWRGIFIFDAASKEEVEGYLKADPAIAAGRLDYEIHPWWTAKNCVFR